MGLFSRSRRAPAGPTWVRVAYARHQPEADMLAGLLGEIEVPVLIRRATMDVPEMMAGGPREILVPADREIEARALLDPAEPLDGDPDQPA